MQKVGAPHANGGPKGLSRKLFLIATAVLQLVVILLISYRYSIETPTFHLDGAFQNASSQFRLKSGQLPGRDFFPYLGIGPTLFTFPFFLLFGGNLAATVVASRLVTLCTLLVTAALIGYLTGFRDRRLAAALFSTGALVFYVSSLLIPFLNNLPGAAAIPIMAEPMNSMRPVRSFLPYVLALASLAVFRKTTKSSTKVVMLSVVTGSLCAVWSNDFGISTFALCALVGTVVIVRFARGKIRLRLLLLWFVGLGVSAATSLSVATGFQPLSMASYNFLDVARDQYWYFAPWGPNTRINTILDLTQIVWTERAIYPLLVLLVVTFLAIKNREPKYYILGLIGAALFGGGLVATIGGHSAGYFLSFIYWGILSATGLTAKLVISWLVRREFLGFAKSAKSLVSSAIVAVLIITTGVSAYWVYDTRRDLALDKNYEYSQLFGGYLDIDSAMFLQGLPDLETIEEYYGLYSVSKNSFAGEETDALIHALGSQRLPLLHRLAETQQVITTNPRFSYWASWSLSANWWFFRELFTNYSPSSRSSKLVAWSRNSQPRARTSVSCEVNFKNNTISVASGEPGFYEVAIVYKSNTRPSRSYSMLENNINFASDADGYLALNPRQKVNLIPVILTEGNHELSVKTFPADAGSEFDLAKCTAFEIAGGEELFIKLGY